MTAEATGIGWLVLGTCASISSSCCRQLCRCSSHASCTPAQADRQYWHSMRRSCPVPALLLFCRQLVVISRQLFDPSLPPEQRRQLQEEQLKPLQQLVAEAAAAYYTAAGARLRQKQLDLTTTLGSCPPEINAAIAFKVWYTLQQVSATISARSVSSCVLATNS